MKLAPELITMIMDKSNFVTTNHLLRLNKNLTLFMKKYSQMEKREINYYIFLIFRNRIKKLMIDEQAIEQRLKLASTRLFQLYDNDYYDDYINDQTIGLKLACSHNLLKLARLFPIDNSKFYGDHIERCVISKSHLVLKYFIDCNVKTHLIEILIEKALILNYTNILELLINNYLRLSKGSGLRSALSYKQTKNVVVKVSIKRKKRFVNIKISRSKKIEN